MCSVSCSKAAREREGLWSRNSTTLKVKGFLVSLVVDHYKDQFESRFHYTLYYPQLKALV